MKFVNSREFRLNPTSVWEILQSGEDVVVTMHGKPMGILLGTNEDNFEQIVQEVNLLKTRMSVRTIRKQARAAGLDKLSMEEIDLMVKEANASYLSSSENM